MHKQQQHHNAIGSFNYFQEKPQLKIGLRNHIKILFLCRAVSVAFNHFSVHTKKGAFPFPSTHLWCIFMAFQDFQMDDLFLI